MTQSPHRLSPEACNALLADTNPYLSCDECFEKLDAYVEDLFNNVAHLDPAIGVHLSACAACAEEAATMLELLAQDAT